MRPTAPAATLGTAPPSDPAVPRPPRPAQAPNRYQLDRLTTVRPPLFCRYIRYSHSPRIAGRFVAWLTVAGRVGMVAVWGLGQTQMKCDDTAHRSRPLAATRLAPACSGLLRLAPGETKRPVSPDRSPSRLRHSTPPATLTAWRPRPTPARRVLRALRSQPWGDHQHHLKQPEYPAQERPVQRAAVPIPKITRRSTL